MQPDTGLALYSSPRFTPSDDSASGDRGLALYLSPRFTPSDDSASGDRGLALYLSPRFTPSDDSASGDRGLEASGAKLLAPRGGADESEIIPGHCRRSERGYFRSIVRRRDLDDIRADERKILEPAKNRLSLP